ncbi:dipeptide transporter ATP-binding subunit [Variovorax sp. PBS-H4]|nr:hypothetical protein [Variovorax sp. PBS-H4]VTU26220.1 dipeptide transporter ATP-binding subunit [Variovorax sp. PBS-H4]
MTFMGTDTLLSVNDLKVHFLRGTPAWGRPAEVVKAVDGVSFQVRRGSTLAVVGDPAPARPPPPLQ